MYSNIHMHTHYCDGGEEPVKYVHEAIKNNLKSIGFSAHAPAPFECNWALPGQQLSSYIAEIQKLKTEYQSRLQIYLGLEVDYFPDIVPYTRDLLKRGSLDYFIGSVHFIDKYPDGKRWTIDGSNEEFKKGFSEIFHNDPIPVIRKFFSYTREMVHDLRPPVIGHIDKLKMQNRPDCNFSEDHPVFQEELLKTLELISKEGLIVEINTRGIYKKRDISFYPGRIFFRKMAEMGVKVMVNSDAHLPDEITREFENAFKALREEGFKQHYILIDNQYKATDIPKF